MFGKPGSAAGDEISVRGLVVGLMALVAGALIMGLIPLLSALNRLGVPGTSLLVLGIALLAIAFVPVYERLNPSSPPTPRRDLVVIVFAALLIGLWGSYLSNEMVAVLILCACGA